MATGVQPFTGATSAVVFEGILGKPPASPVRLNSAIPRELEHIINKALEKDRTLRYQHASEMFADLRRVQRGSGATAAAPIETRSRRPALPGVAMAAAAIAPPGDRKSTRLHSS